MRNLFFITAVCLVAACTSEERLWVIESNHVNLSDLQVGQSSKYLRYFSTCEDFRTDFDYSGDTLIWEVVEENDSLFFQEYLTPGSLSMISADIDTVKYFVDSHPERILIPDRERSQLFYFYGNDTIFLSRSHTAVLEQENCRLFIENEPFTGEEIGLVPLFRVGDYSVTRKTGVSCVPMIVQLEAYLIYDYQSLFISHTIGSGVSGWIRLSDDGVPSSGQW